MEKGIYTSDPCASMIGKAERYFFQLGCLRAGACEVKRSTGAV